MDGKARRGVESADGVLGDERIHVNLTIRRQVWTLARQRFPNVSRLVERLLEVALGLESSFEIVRIGDWGCRGSLAWKAVDSRSTGRSPTRVQIPAPAPLPSYSKSIIQ